MKTKHLYRSDTGDLLDATSGAALMGPGPAPGRSRNWFMIHNRNIRNSQKQKKKLEKK